MIVHKQPLFPERTYLSLIAIGLIAVVMTVSMLIFSGKMAAPPDSLNENALHSVNDIQGLRPLRFMPNAGQIQEQSVRFSVKNDDHAIFFTPSEVVFSFARPVKDDDATSDVLRLDFVGANPTPEIEGLSQLPGAINIFRGNAPAQWQVGVPTYETIAYRQLYPGIDLVYSGETGALKSEFIVSPQANPARIRLAYTGARELNLRDDGALVLITAHGELVEAAPVVYQEIEGRRVDVAAAYQLLPNQQVNFRLDAYNPNYPLIIDPIIVYGSYLGGGATERGNAIAIDDAKNIYVVGTTVSDDFPVANAFDDTYDGGTNGDVFVAKLDATGTTLIYATYLGGSADDLGYGVAADAAGNAYVVGQTDSEDFPLNNPLDDECGSIVNGTPVGCNDGFVVKLNPTGSTLSYATYLGGDGIDAAVDVVLDGDSNAYLSGYTSSTDFPTTPGSLQPNANFATRGSSSDSFVAKIASDGSSLLYATYLGGSGSENIGANPVPSAIAVDAQGQVIVTGQTVSDDFPVLNAAQPTYAGGSTPSVGGDAFVAKLTADGSGLIFATYLGGGDDENRAGNAGIAVDGDGNILVTGYTASEDFPVQNALQSTFGGGSSDAFVAKYASGGTLQYATFLGGDNLEYSHSIAVDSPGNSYVVGMTFSDDFPTVDPIPGQCTPSVCAFVTQISGDGAGLIYSSFLGGVGGNNTAYDIVVDDAQAAYVVGETNSTNFTTVSPVQPERGGGFDAFMVKIAPAERVYLPVAVK